MSKHTPGPWHLVADQVFSDTNMVDLIAEVTGGSGRQYIDDDTNAECLANARLITAAPELLAALREAIQQLYDQAGEALGSGRYKHLEIAIAKATGPQPQQPEPSSV